MRFVAEGVSLVVFASVVRRFDDLAARRVRAVFYSPMRFVAERVSLVVFASVVGRIDDLAARPVGAALHLRQAALAVRACTSEFVDFLDAVRAQANAARLAGWASRAAGRARWLSWDAALLLGRSLFARKSDENQEGEEAEEEAEREPRAAAVSFLIR